ncbi:MAG: hypothetical protein E6Q32_01295 [Neisseriales bacterium]|nr:MAG: hypothetical protein E6Q32_01295 [Neisseriales bacterium]
MKQIKPILLLSTLIYCGSSYADWPVAFNLCNHSHSAYNVTLSNFNNISWRIGSGGDWNKNTNLELKEHQCTLIFVKPNEHNYNKYSSFKVDYSGKGGHASFLLKTDPNDIKHLEANVAHWTMYTWWANNNNMKIEAPVKKITRCQNGACQDISNNKLTTWMVSENTNNKYSDGSYKFYPVDQTTKVQNINLLQTTDNPENYTNEEKALLAEVYKNLKALIPQWHSQHKTGPLDLTIRRNDGKSLDLWQRGAICKLYDPYVNVDYTNVSMEPAGVPKVSALSPIAVTTEDYTNSSESATKFRSLEVAATSIKVFSDTTKNTLSFKNNVTVTSTIKVPAVSDTSKSISIEMEVANGKTTLNEAQKSQTIISPSNNVVVPAKSKFHAVVNLATQKVAGKVYVNYPIKDYNISGDWALDGNCRNKNDSNLVPVKVRLDFLAMDSIDPDKFGMEKSSGSGTKIALRDYHEYTTEVGYNYSRTSKITPLSGGAAYMVTESMPYYYADKIPANTAKSYSKPLI